MRPDEIADLADVDRWENLSLWLYRRAQVAQASGDPRSAAHFFLLSILAQGDDHHPNALYQAAWSFACQGEWEACSIAVHLLLRQTPHHEAGGILRGILVQMGCDFEKGTTVRESLAARVSDTTLTNLKSLRLAATRALEDEERELLEKGL